MWSSLILLNGFYCRPFWQEGVGDPVRPLIGLIEEEKPQSAARYCSQVAWQTGSIYNVLDLAIELEC